MQKKFYVSILNVLLSKKDNQTKKELLNDYHDCDIAMALTNLPKSKRLEAYSILGLSKVAEVFTFYPNPKDYIMELSIEKGARVLEKMDSNDALRILDQLDDDYKDKILASMQAISKFSLEKLDSYDDELIGSYMSNNFITINKNYSIKQAMQELVNNAGIHDNISILFVVDDENNLYGYIRLKDLIIARKDDQLDDICMTSCPFVYDDEKIDDCLNRLKNYSEDSMPVINHSNQLLGVILVDSLIELVEEDLEDDYAKLGGVSESDDLEGSLFSSMKKRIPWLVILLFFGVIVSTVISRFEVVIAALPAIVFFQSMVLDMAGNVGTQSLAVTIRNLSDDKMIKKIIFKEVRLGILNGLVIAIIGFIFVLCYLFISHQEIIAGNGFVWTDTFKVSSIISLSLLLSMTFSSFVGTVFPIILTKVHIDPAVASGPFITTLNDIIAVVVYYGLTYIFFLFLI